MTVQKNILHYYVELLRIKDDEKRTPKQSESCVTALHNIISTMRLSRNDKICKEDFSCLDFGNIPFNGIHFSMDGENPCRFDGCKLNEWNFMSGHSGSVNSVAWSSDGKYILTGSNDRTAILWDAQTSLMIKVFKGHSKWVDSVAFSPNGKYVMTGSSDDTAKIWSLNTGKCIKTLAGHSWSVKSVAFSPNGKYVLTCSKNTAKIWDLEKGEILRTLEGHSESICSVAFSPDGNYCLTGSWDNTAKIWNIETGKCVHSLEEHSSQITSVCFTSDGKYILTGSQDCSVKIWDCKTIKCFRTLKTNSKRVLSVAISPNENNCLTGLHDNTAKIWNIETLKCLQTFEGHSEPITSVCFSPDEKYVLTGSVDNSAKIWDSTTGKCLQTLHGHFHIVTDIYFSNSITALQEDPLSDSYIFLPDNKKYCLTGSAGKIANIWDIASGKCLKTIQSYHCDPKCWRISERSQALDDEGRIICRIYKYDSEGKEKPELLGEFYNIDGMYIKNCSFHNIITDLTTCKILYQYGGNLEKPKQ